MSIAQTESANQRELTIDSGGGGGVPCLDDDGVLYHQPVCGALHRLQEVSHTLTTSSSQYLPSYTIQYTVPVISGSSFQLL